MLFFFEKIFVPFTETAFYQSLLNLRGETGTILLSDARYRPSLFMF